MKRRHLVSILFFCVAYLLSIAWGLYQYHYMLQPLSKQTIAWASPALSTRYGQRGGYVWEMQNRLQFLGFYGGKIDGVFGDGTLQSVRLFQSRFGLTVDGIVGTQTKHMLWKATRNWNVTPTSNTGLSAREIDMITRCVYGEARGEPYIGQVAVAAVIMNRVRSEKFPNTPSAVIFQPGAFTAVSDSQIWLQPNQTAYQATRDALNGWDPSDGALYYFNPVTATSKWIWSRPQIKKIGKHIFCR
ncbi:N-acetylmuramoyl-L-alanine amidase [Seinonella peptonophila]|uniref:Spore cortex-lytic enzyme n=1 Tax=Seinonella peptonophila TaxID=112248 RepID=A0A1M4U563_9BACL|nr:spore cortex-lytic enzyme [Seinonella peptonophila]SHE51971.1 N-acetylmuramoyl-L-alanine amidase [Seinonella peptonophila]